MAERSEEIPGKEGKTSRPKEQGGVQSFESRNEGLGFVSRLKDRLFGGGEKSDTHDALKEVAAGTEEDIKERMIKSEYDVTINGQRKRYEEVKDRDSDTRIVRPIGEYHENGKYNKYFFEKDLLKSDERDVVLKQRDEEVAKEASREFLERWRGRWDKAKPWLFATGEAVALAAVPLLANTGHTEAAIGVALAAVGSAALSMFSSGEEGRKLKAAIKSSDEKFKNKAKSLDDQLA